MNAYWSYLLTAVGVFGLWLAGRKDRRGWIVGVFAQVLWIAYATATQQWGFYVSALAYGWVYVRNARAWRPESGPTRPSPGPEPLPAPLRTSEPATGPHRGEDA